MKKLTALFVSTPFYLALASKALAQSPAPAPAGSINICPAGDFETLCNLVLGDNLIANIINLAFIVAVVIALAFLIYGGIKWIMSGGDKGGVETARNIIVAALVGLVITFLSYFLLDIVFKIFGLNPDNVFSVDSLNIFKQ